MIVLLPDSSRDQRVIQLLIMLLRHWIDAGDLGTLFQENFLMRLRQPRRRGRVPDLLFVARQHADRLRPTYLDGPGDLAVEVISPDSGQRDRIDKFREYELAGVPEYWLIDPLREWAEFYELDAEVAFNWRWRAALDPTPVRPWPASGSSWSGSGRTRRRRLLTCSASLG